MSLYLLLFFGWDRMASVLLLLLLSHFSRVWLCVTPQTAAHQAPPSLGFSRQAHWSGLPFPSPMHESEKWKGSRSVVSDSQDPMDCSPPGSSVHEIFQARVLEWVAIAFSEAGRLGIAKFSKITGQHSGDGVTWEALFFWMELHSFLSLTPHFLFMSTTASPIKFMSSCFLLQYFLGNWGWAKKV